uniref:Uncharacterized protein n=1 Tax=Siphoviridae sp. ctzpQ31 TaxID=2823613 RepID=A0A8S5L8L8_9CAUD|nr:MAG TPA: hypothetical protein [Siphoviridae sp. ctzpQ31]
MVVSFRLSKNSKGKEQSLLILPQKFVRLPFNSRLFIYSNQLTRSTIITTKIMFSSALTTQNEEKK